MVDEVRTETEENSVGRQGVQFTGHLVWGSLAIFKQKNAELKSFWGKSTCLLVYLYMAHLWDNEKVLGYFWLVTLPYTVVIKDGVMNFRENSDFHWPYRLCLKLWYFTACSVWRGRSWGTPRLRTWFLFLLTLPPGFALSWNHEHASLGTFCFFIL